MTGIGFLILFGLNCLLLPCSKGSITSPPDGTQYVFLPTKTAKIKWEFDDPISSLVGRVWYFTRSDGSPIESLASIYENESTIIRTRLFEFDIERPATLVLRNVNQSYNGEYQFVLLTTRLLKSYVTVHITKKPTVTLDCANPFMLNEGFNFICECKGLSGNPPANVTWYKDGNKMQGNTGTEKKLLILTNIDETDNGTYKCVAESYPDPLYRDEISITLVGPTGTSIQLDPNPVTLGQSFIITCSSGGFPEPSYKISYNGSHLTDVKTYTINNVEWSDAGVYECNAENGLGNDKASKSLKVTVERGPITTQKPSIPNTSEKNISNGSGCDGSGTVVIWHIVVTLLSGIIIGILFSYIVLCSRRCWCRNKKPGRNSEPQADGVDKTYQELDVTKMNKEDNYQSLKGNVVTRASNDVGNDEESTYTQLSKIRDVEDNYQSLT